MLNRAARDELATALERLVDGEMTNDEFDDQYYEHWLRSEDAAVAEVATFGWALYSDITTYRLRGRHAVPHEIRKRADRARLFLQTDLACEWPQKVRGVVPYFCLWGPGWYLAIGLILLFVAAFTPGSRWGAALMGVMGLLAIVPTIHWLCTNRERAEEVRRFHESGDVDVWPFLRKADYEEAQRALAAGANKHG
jgi:hypothetical protein